MDELGSRMQTKSVSAVAILLLVSAAAAYSVPSVVSWGNGGYSDDPTAPAYGTHDWVAHHALDWLPMNQKQFLVDNLASYLYGTELPDNNIAADGKGDTSRHHVYFYANGSLQDNSSAIRANEEYLSAQASFGMGNVSGAAKHLGMAAHYVADMAVFGHVMGASTSWGAESHHSDYEDYVLARTDNYTSEFSDYLIFDDNLDLTSAYDAAILVAQHTTFDSDKGLTCTWMDQYYNWTNPTFKSRCGELINLATNAVADVLHSFYAETIMPSPAATPQVPEFPEELTIVFLALTLVLVCLASFYRRNLSKKTSSKRDNHSSKVTMWSLFY
jgi:hypothetical protein